MKDLELNYPNEAEGDQGLETENCQSLEQSPKNVHSLSRSMRAVLGGILGT